MSLHWQGLRQKVLLAQACLSWWSTVSPFGGTGSTAALTFVVLVAGVKAIWEDSKRHKEDRRTNASTAHVLRNNGMQLPPSSILSST